MRCPFKIGDWIRFDDDEGYVTFIGKEYLTCCVREWKDDNLLHGIGQCKVLIYASNWQDCVLTKSGTDINNYKSQEYRYEDIQ